VLAVDTHFKADDMGGRSTCHLLCKEKITAVWVDNEAVHSSASLGDCTMKHAQSACFVAAESDINKMTIFVLPCYNNA